MKNYLFKLLTKRFNFFLAAVWGTSAENIGRSKSGRCDVVDFDLALDFFLSGSV